MLYPQLDERLQAAFTLFDACELGADIGADHGRLSGMLLKSGKCQRMIVSDISADSLQKARRLFAMHQLEERADFRVADGFEALRAGEKVTCAALCGIGGQLMSKLLLRAPLECLPDALVLSANTDMPRVRLTLLERNYRITAELIVRAKGRFYVILRAEKGIGAYSEREIYLGPVLLQERPPLFREYLTWRAGVVACEAGHERQLQWIKEELAHVSGECADHLELAE